MIIHKGYKGRVLGNLEKQWDRKPLSPVNGGGKAKRMVVLPTVCQITLYSAWKSIVTLDIQESFKDIVCIFYFVLQFMEVWITELFQFIYELATVSNSFKMKN